MNKTKRLIEEAILFAINSIREDICENVNVADNEHRAMSIKMLAEAYDIVHRGKKGDRKC